MRALKLSGRAWKRAKGRNINFRLTSVAQKRLCLSSLIFELKVWSECKNGEGEWGETLFSPHTDHAYDASCLPKTSENAFFAVYLEGFLLIFKVMINE